MTRSSQ